jgi:hypothetical protein
VQWHTFAKYISYSIKSSRATSHVKIELQSNVSDALSASILREWCDGSESESLYGWRSVSQSVSQYWCQAPSGTHDQIFSPTWWLLWSLFSWGALSDERVGLSFVRSLCHVIKSIYISIYTIHYKVCIVCTRPLAVHALWSRLCLILLNLCYDDS